MAAPHLALMRLAALGVSVSASTAAGVITATIDTNPFTIGTALGTVFAFAGLLVQQVLRNQRAVWAIVRSKEDDIDRLQWANDRLQWDNDRLRFRLGEGADPGPFTPTRERRP